MQLIVLALLIAAAVNYKLSLRASKTRKTAASAAQLHRQMARRLRAGVLCAAGGAVTALGGALTLAENVEWLFWALAEGYGVSYEVEAILGSLAILAAGAGLLWAGAQLAQRVSRFNMYHALIEKRAVVPVSDLARSTGKNREQVARELQQLIRKGYFPQGFVDLQTACFYANNAAWRQNNPEAAAQQDAPLFAEAPAPQPADPQPAGAFGVEYIRQLEAMAPGLENVAVARKTAALCAAARDIADWVAQHPASADAARRLTSYYLPTAVKLLSSYRQVAPHADDSTTAAQVEQQVLGVLDTMTAACRSLLENLLQNTAVDLQAEISALETVLAQEGLLAGQLPSLAAAEPVSTQRRTNP